MLQGVGEGDMVIEGLSFVSREQLGSKKGEDFEFPMFCIKATEVLGGEEHKETVNAKIVKLEAFQQELQKSLLKYSSLFEEPKVLPPFRSHNHSIPLLPNAQPVNTRPYGTPTFKRSRLRNWLMRCYKIT